MKKQYAVLGYHEPGEFHYFSIFNEGIWLGEDSKEKFDSTEKFAGLVTAIHEHYHLIQELQLGFNWWRQITEEKVLAELLGYSEFKKADWAIRFPLWPDAQLDTPALEGEITDPLLHAKRAVFQLHQIDKSYTSNTVTRRSIDWESEASPDFRSRINQDLYDLTIHDLIECQAAILTEILISKMLVESPEKFNKRIVEKLSPLFRVNLMPEEYGKPLRGLLHILSTAGMRFEFPKEAKAHQFYSHIENGELYVLLSFLLDYALHIPPDPLEIYSEVLDLGALQDIHPPLRFLSLCIVLLAEVYNNKYGNKNKLLSEKLLYSDASKVLSDLVNRMHSGANPGRPRTFFSIEETTKMWGRVFKEAPLQDNFPELSILRGNCIAHRISGMDQWIDPLSMALKVGLPRVVITNKGLRSMPYIRDEKKELGDLTRKEQIEFLKEAYIDDYTGFTTGSMEEKNGKFPATLVPFRFVEEKLAHKMLCKFASALLIKGKMRCPLTESIGRYVPCKSRGSHCELIDNFTLLPVKNCLLRERIEQQFKDINRFEKRIE